MHRPHYTKKLCPSITNVTALLPSSHHYCLHIIRPIPVTAPTSLHKTLCLSITNDTALLHPSHRYCRYISRTITVIAPPHYTNIMTQSHKSYCLLPLSRYYCLQISRPIQVTAPLSLHKTLCPSLTNVTAFLPPSHHYCRYISRQIPVTAPPHYTKHYASVSQPLLPFYPRHTITAAT